MERFAIGADLGGTNLRVAAVTEAGTILNRVSLRTRNDQGREAVIRELAEAIRSLTKTFQQDRSLAGIGIGVPGIIYLKTGMLRESPNLPGWENYPVRSEIESLVGSTVFLENDANVAALGEKWLGVGQSVDSLCMLTLGTGVGGGLIFDGKIFHGFLGMAGELGHMTVSENGTPCPCGSHGCIETEASATAVIRHARELIASGKSPALKEAATKSDLTAKLVYQVAEAGDVGSIDIFHRLGRYLGITIAGLVNALNLPLYVIAGGVAEAWDQFAPTMMEEIRQRSYIYREGSTRVEKSCLGGDAGLLGAAYLPLESIKEGPSQQG